MTREDLIAGKSFQYKGKSFYRFRWSLLQVTENTVTVNNVDAEYTFSIETVTDKGFVCFNRSFGRITILFSDCKQTEVFNG